MEIIEALRWPVVVVVGIVVLRIPLGRLVEKTQKVKYKDVELEFRQEIEQIARQVPGVAESDLVDGLGGNEVTIDLRELAELSPHAAVVESWKSVEAHAKALIKVRGHDLDYEISTPYKLIQDTLLEAKILDVQSGQAFEQLRRLRNKVVHADGFQLTTERATDFVEQASRLRTYLDYLAKQSA